MIDVICEYEVLRKIFVPSLYFFSQGTCNIRSNT